MRCGPRTRICGPRNTLGTDFQIFRNVAELDGHVHRDLRHRIARHRQPQAHSQRQREQLDAEIVQHVPAKKVFHASARLPELTRESARVRQRKPLRCRLRRSQVPRRHS